MALVVQGLLRESMLNPDPSSPEPEDPYLNPSFPSSFYMRASEKAQAIQGTFPVLRDSEPYSSIPNPKLHLHTSP